MAEPTDGKSSPQHGEDGKQPHHSEPEKDHPSEPIPEHEKEALEKERWAIKVGHKCGPSPGQTWVQHLVGTFKGSNGNEDGYERFKVRSLPQEEKDRQKDNDPDRGR